MKSSAFKTPKKAEVVRFIIGKYMPIVQNKKKIIKDFGLKVNSF